MSNGNSLSTWNVIFSIFLIGIKKKKKKKNGLWSEEWMDEFQFSFDELYEWNFQYEFVNGEYHP